MKKRYYEVVKTVMSGEDSEMDNGKEKNDKEKQKKSNIKDRVSEKGSFIGKEQIMEIIEVLYQSNDEKEVLEGIIEIWERIVIEKYHI